MSVDQFMETIVSNQGRIIALLEQIVSQTPVVLNLQPNHEAVTHAVGSVSETKVTPVREKSGDELLGEDKAAMKREAAQRQTEAAATATATAGSTGTKTSGPAQETAQQESSGSSVNLKKADGKAITPDDARKAVKAFAAVEGNEAAMELLGSFGAASISAVAEQGEEKLAELYWKAGGK
jgi:hypothetical protein